MSEDQQTSLKDIKILLQTVIEENKVLREENKKIFTHFAAEFIALKKCVEEALNVMKKPIEKSLLSCLPFYSVLDVLNFDKELAINEDIKFELVSRYKLQPLNDLRKFIFENLKLIFGDGITTSKFSWTNANENISVKNLACIKILTDVAENSIPQTTYQDVERIMKKFFIMTKDRLNKTNKRQTTANGADNTSVLFET